MQENPPFQRGKEGETTAVVKPSGGCGPKEPPEVSPCRRGDTIFIERTTMRHEQFAAFRVTIRLEAPHRLARSVDEDLDEVPLAYTSATSEAKKASALLGRTCCMRVVAPGSASGYWWNRVVTLDGGCIQFPDPQLEQAKDPEPNVRALGDSQSTQNTIRRSK
jgi:hypothetical protein